jgi:hypothetical protein
MIIVGLIVVESRTTVIMLTIITLYVADV